MKTLLLIDIQNGFDRTIDTNKVSKKIPELVEKCQFDKIIMTKYKNSEDSNISTILGWKKMTTKQEIAFSVNLEDYNPIVFEKETYSCVNQEFLDYLDVLYAENEKKIVYIAGLDTDCCVLMSAVDLMEQGYIPYVLTDCCASSGGTEFHKAGLKLLSRMIGSDHLITSDTLLKK